MSRYQDAQKRRARLLLAFGWIAAQFVVWQLVVDVRTRIGLAVMTALALPVADVLFRPSPRSKR